MVEDKLISKNKLLMYLADLELTYAPVCGKGEAEKYNFIKELSRIFEQWDGETVSKTKNVECEDCISRQAAIDAAIEAADEWDGGYSLTRAEMIENKLKDLPSAQLKQRWIPVSEHLPKQNEMVLITIIRKDERYNKIPFISTGYISWNNTAWWCAHDGDCKSANVEVLAWLPLPEPYRAERRTDG